VHLDWGACPEISTVFIHTFLFQFKTDYYDIPHIIFIHFRLVLISGILPPFMELYRYGHHPFESLVYKCGQCKNQQAGEHGIIEEITLCEEVLYQQESYPTK